MFNLAENETSHAFVRGFYQAIKVVSAVCHGPAALANVELSNRTYLIARLNVIGISDVEEDILQFSRHMSFVLDTELREYGGIYEKADGLFGVKVITSGENGKLVTDQNTSSAALLSDEPGTHYDARPTCKSDADISANKSKIVSKVQPPFRALIYY
ncbi:hypothetical protein AnigIFM56816_010372 [Aspergillus niger]|nr:hypothetical protein AnigIFM56816_010372 [Aspergillus niger]